MVGELTRAMVADNPIAALAIARELARDGLDARELMEAAIAALSPKHPRNAQPEGSRVA